MQAPFPIFRRSVSLIFFALLTERGGMVSAYYAKGSESSSCGLFDIPWTFYQIS
jgi:hypothetical protein